jgi:hypothetical protein
MSVRSLNKTYRVLITRQDKTLLQMLFDQQTMLIVV